MAVGAILVLAVDAEGDRQSRPRTEYRLLGEKGIFNRAVCMTRLEVGSVVTVMKKPNQNESKRVKSGAKSAETRSASLKV